MKKKPAKRTAYILDWDSFEQYLSNLLDTGVSVSTEGYYDVRFSADHGSGGDYKGDLTELLERIGSDLGVTLESCHAGEGHVWLLAREEQDV